MVAFDCFSSIVPQWAQWAQWSDCSMTCDRGIQTRTRSCVSNTESNTEDGYVNTCGQLNDETHALETRECLLLGNHRYCPCKYSLCVNPLARSPGQVKWVWTSEINEKNCLNK